MNTDHIQEAFVLKKLDDPLRNVYVTIGDRKVAALGGRLNVTTDGAPRLEIYFEHDPLNQGAGLKRGTVIPETHYATITAETHSGYDLQAKRVFYDRITGFDFTRFEFFPGQVELSRGDPLPTTKAGVEGIVMPFPERVTNSDYMIEDNCPMFGRGSHGAWLRIEMESVSLGLRKSEGSRKFDEGIHELKIWSKIPGDLGLQELGQAFLHSLSFLTGRRLGWRTRCFSHDKREIVVLKKPTQQTVRFHPPLPELVGREMMDHQTDLLLKGTRFFQMSESEAALTALQVCWDSAGNFFVTRDLLLCIAVEGLADYIVDESPRASVLCPEQAAFLEAKRKIIKAILDAELVKSTSPGHFDGDGDLVRLVKGMEAFGWLRASEKIVKAGELVGVEFNNDELKAWKTLRNKPAHGDFDYDSDRDALQNSFWSAAKVAGMLNKLVLALIGYTGPIVDYATQGFPAASFP